MRILEAECIRDRVLLIFDDGTGALFTADTLHAYLHLAAEVVHDLGEFPESVSR